MVLGFSLYSFYRKIVCQFELLFYLFQIQRFTASNSCIFCFTCYCHLFTFCDDDITFINFLCCRRYKEKKEEVTEPEADPERDQRTVFAYQVKQAFLCFSFIFFSWLLCLSAFWFQCLVNNFCRFVWRQTKEMYTISSQEPARLIQCH